MQSVDGVPIVDASLEAHLDEDGRLLAITGGLVPDPTLESTDPDVSRDEALDAAAEGVAGPDDGLRRQARGVQLRGRAAARLAGDGERFLHRSLRHARGRRDGRGRAPGEPRQVRGAGRGVRQLSRRRARAARPALSRSTPYLDPSPTRLSGPNAHAFVDTRGRGARRRASTSSRRPRAARRHRAPAPTSSTRSASTLTADYDCGAAFRCSWDPKTPLELGRRQRPGGHPALLLREPLPRPPRGRARHRVHAASFEGSRPGGRPGPGRRRQAGRARRHARVPRAPSTRTTRTCWCSPTGAAPGALMQMYLWDPTRDPDLDEEPNYRPVHGGDDPSLVFHEYTHGLTNRLVTDAAGLRRAERSPGRGDRRGHGRLVRARLPGGRRRRVPIVPDDGSAPDVTLAGYEVDGPTGLRTQAIDCPVGENDPSCPERRRQRRGGRIHLRRLRQDPRRRRGARRRRDLGADALAAARGA